MTPPSGSFKERYKGFLRRAGKVQAAVLLGLVYLLLWIPVGLVSRLFADWLRRRTPKGSLWWDRQARLNQPQHLKDPY